VKSNDKAGNGMKAPPARTEIFQNGKALDERIRRAGEEIAAILKRENLVIRLPVTYEQGPEGWIRGKASFRLEAKG
jgi:hypothetical protein